MSYSIIFYLILFFCIAFHCLPLFRYFSFFLYYSAFLSLFLSICPPVHHHIYSLLLFFAPSHLTSSSSLTFCHLLIPSYLTSFYLFSHVLFIHTILTVSTEDDSGNVRRVHAERRYFRLRGESGSVGSSEVGLLRYIKVKRLFTATVTLIYTVYFIITLTVTFTN